MWPFFKILNSCGSFRMVVGCCYSLDVCPPKSHVEIWSQCWRWEVFGPDGKCLGHGGRSLINRLMPSWGWGVLGRGSKEFSIYLFPQELVVKKEPGPSPSLSCCLSCYMISAHPLSFTFLHGWKQPEQKQMLVPRFSYSLQNRKS